MRRPRLTAPSETTVVRTAKDGDLLVVTIDHPPVNAISVDVRRGLMAAMDEAEADAAVKGVLLLGAGRAFIAGADIREFGRPPMHPILPEVCNRIEACSKPVVAAIHGPALGLSLIHI
jgi:3-hydroxyacyl-CoA dehydrogenase